MATVELAFAIPALLAVLALVTSGLRLGVDSVRCVDAVRSAAQAVSRGEGARASAIVADRGPRFAAVHLAPLDGGVMVSVRAPAPEPLGRLGIKGCSERVWTIQQQGPP